MGALQIILTIPGRTVGTRQVSLATERNSMAKYNFANSLCHIRQLA